MKKLKILFVSRDKFPPFRVDVSVLFGKEIRKKGHIIDWVLQSDEKCTKGYYTKWSGGNAWVGPTNNGTQMFNRTIKHLLRFIHASKCAVQIIKKRYDIFQVKDCFFTALVYLMIAKVKKTCYFYWLSYPVPEALLYAIKEGTARYPFVYLIRATLYKIILYKIIMKYADHIFVQSEQMKLDIYKEGIDRDKTTPIPMGFEADSFSTKGEDEINGNSDKYSIVYIGTLIRIRRIDFVIRVFAKVLEKIPTAKLYLVGKGEDDEDLEILKREAIKLGILKSIVFTGFVSRDRALKLVKTAGVCLSPFYPTPILNSTSPTKLIEYMAMAKPVVANDHPEQKYVIENSNGGICVPYKEDEFAEAIVHIIEDQDAAKQMGINGYHWVLSNRSYSIIANNILNIYYEHIR